MHNSAVIYLDNAVKKFEDKIALIDNKNTYTFKEYQNLSLRIGTYILEHMKNFEDKNQVAVYLPKNIKTIVSFMGILYSGNSYVPIDINMPINRVEKILLNLEPEFIITTLEYKNILIEKLNVSENKILILENALEKKANRKLIDEKLDLIIDTDPIYIKYTSGSTGNPKGVVISHKGVIDYANWIINTFDLNEKTIMGNQAPFYFDNSIVDIYGSIFSGATLNIIPEILFNFPIKIPEYINENKINFIFFVPTVLINIANSGILENFKNETLEKVLFCGEVMPNKQLNIWRNNMPNIFYANLYGPTEITDVCTYFIVDKIFKDSDPLPIGKPCKNVGTLILNNKNEKTKVNEIGELCILGTGLALGYFKEEELTKKAFMQNPLNKNYKEEIYRTGDLVYKNQEDLIIFVGRKDSQIQHKGNRIELGEIETISKSLEEIGNACVIYNNIKQEIVLFIELNSEITEKNILNKIRKLLPVYMLPNKIIVKNKLPLNLNGKIDRPLLKKELEN